MENPETDIIAQIDALAGPDPAAEARAEAETAALATRAARFVSNRAGRWAECPQRTCRRASACTGDGLPAKLPPCGVKADWQAVNELVMFALIERLRGMAAEFEARFGGAPFSQRSGDGD
jgi:hypothetical protein